MADEMVEEMIRQTAVMDLYSEDVDTLDLPQHRKKTLKNVLGKFKMAYYTVTDFFHRNGLPIPEMPKYLGMFQEKPLKVMLDTGSELRHYKLPLPGLLKGYYNRYNTKTASNEAIEDGTKISELDDGIAKVDEMLSYNLNRRSRRILATLKGIYQIAKEDAKDPNSTYKTFVHELLHHFLQKAIKNPMTYKSWNDSLKTTEAIEGSTVEGTDAILNLKTTRKGEAYNFYKEKVANSLRRYRTNFVEAVKRFVNGDPTPVYAINQEFSGYR